ncbi:MAG: hypothetical protein ACP6IU_09635 [Candidatus Asgardarchaeia archaeon]|nr:MAG: hypothetical protein DRO67_01330 [Candidatus Asgardarchaeum californiense]
MFEYLREYYEKIIRELDEKYAIREQIYMKIREGIRSAANTIHALHNNDIPKAKEYLKHLESLKNELESIKETYPEIYYSNFLLSFMQEFVEAKLFFAIEMNEPLPDSSTLGVSHVAYLLGTCDLIGELRRKVIDLIRVKNLDRALELDNLMLTLYNLISLIELPDSILPGYKRKKDVARSVVERTHSEVTNAILLSNFLSKFKE